MITSTGGSGLPQQACRGAQFYFVVFTLCLCVPLEFAAHADDKDEIAAISKAFAENCEHFREFTFRFSVVKGKSESRDDALAGKIDTEPKEHGLWIVSKDYARYELDRPEIPIVVGPPPSGGQLLQEISYLPDIEVWNRGLGIAARHSRFLKVVNLGRAEDCYSATITPLSMGIMAPRERRSPRGFIDAVVAGTYPCRYLGQKEHGGRLCHVVETLPEPELKSKNVTTWWIDSARGGVPTRVSFQDADGSYRGETVALRLVEAPGGGWYYQRALQIWSRPQGVATLQIEVENYDPSPPKREQLAYPIEAGTQIVDTADMRSFIRVPERTAIHADELGRWRDRCAAALAERLKPQRP